VLLQTIVEDDLNSIDVYMTPEQVAERLQLDVKEFMAHTHKAVGLRTYLVNPNYFVVERPVQPTAKLEFVRTAGAKVVVEFSGFAFSGFTGFGTELHGGPQEFRFGSDSQNNPCLVTAGGTAAYPADISRQAGALLEKFSSQYLYLLRGNFCRPMAV
jgi:hypothetical protein